MTKPKYDLSNTATILLAAIMLFVGAVSVATASEIDEFSNPTAGALARACLPVRLSGAGARLSANQELAAAMCFGYALADGELHRDPPYCTPPSVDLGQRILVFLKWADETPEMHHVDRALAFRHALTLAFPCS